MPGQFNPDKNLFSVAPVGHIVIIGRSISLRGGLSREHALNLATWLLISTGATPEEVKASIQDAMTGTPYSGKTHKTVTGAQRTVPQPAPPKAPPAQTSDVPPEVSGQVTPFIGDIDREEAEAIQAATKPPTVPTVGALPKVKPIDPNDVANAWGGPDNG